MTGTRGERAGEAEGGRRVAVSGEYGQKGVLVHFALLRASAASKEKDAGCGADQVCIAAVS